MIRIWQHIESGAWLTLERVRAYSLIVLALGILAVAGWIAVSDGVIDRNGKPIGTDFSSFYTAGALALEGKAHDSYTVAAHYARQQQLFGSDTPYYAWFYPPIFLLVATPLAMLPYPFALAIWQGGSFVFYLFVISAILKRAALPDAVHRLWLPVAMAFPAAFINLGHGQNGFLTAGLFGSALLALPQRPYLAGILFALMAYKPQFAIVIPLALFAAGQWRCIAAATITIIALTCITTALFGIDCWIAFASVTETSRQLLLEQGQVGFEKLQSAFAAIRMWRGNILSAYLVQGIVSIAVIASAVWAWRVARDANLKAAILLIATLLASPHVLDYDLMLLGPAIAFMIVTGFSTGFRDYEISLLALTWIMPLLTRSIAGAIELPLGFLVMVVFYIIVVRRALANNSTSQHLHTQIAAA
ncbi:glycosyltransferase family 87 protein [Tardiphaga sp. 709]|uniref:glycosyltransferase family 87 protein n=1 Tax=Tardiphaga sp. 709 TaxID=3076039 RepID=UPI0028EF0D67|nr:glycosyltransferase family 87 protein [Tardiphaga sp. 709]WNV08520.1 glycosyltransferase family 87 protein [Tardiphaga sp. 709]